ncbi:MAG: NUDIX domain-containing protein [Flavobacteriales bacterium]
MSVSRFNIRVYGLLIDGGRILVSNELIQGQCVTKFPGGGLEPGEGTLDCLRREIMEEMGLVVLEPCHFYTTDFFQQSAFRAEDQIISIYYTFQVEDPTKLVNDAPAQGMAAEPGQRFRWLHLGEASQEDVDFPIDRVVMELLVKGRDI